MAMVGLYNCGHSLLNKGWKFSIRDSSPCDKGSSQAVFNE